nr:MAG TPA: RecT protein [Bacteriophage sp.]
MSNEGNKNDLIKKEEENMISLIDQTGVEIAIEKLVIKNNSLLPKNIAIDRIKNSAGFYITNRDDLMKLDGNGKLQMLYGVLKEAMVGLEAGTDFDIVPFKGKPVITRKKEGWFKIIDMIKPAEIMRFTANVIFKGDEYSFDPVKEELKHKKVVESDKYDDIEGAYCYIKFANGFEKTIFMSKKDIDVIKRVSPSATSSYSPWTTMPVKMVKTKVVKEMAKELFTLFSSKVNYILAQAINNDENSISRIDNKGNIKNDNIIYSNDYEVQNEDNIPTTKEVSMNEL